MKKHTYCVYAFQGVVVTLIFAALLERATGQVLVANFDNLPETQQPATFTTGGLIFSHNIRSSGQDGGFAVDHFSGTGPVAIAAPSLSAPGLLTLGSFSVGGSIGLTNLYGFEVDFAGLANDMAVDLVSISPSPPNQRFITLEGIRGGLPVVSSTVPVDLASFVYRPHSLRVSGGPFDRARIYSNWQALPSNVGVLAGFDNFRVTLVPEPPTLSIVAVMTTICLTVFRLISRMRHAKVVNQR